MTKRQLEERVKYLEEHQMTQEKVRKIYSKGLMVARSEHCAEDCTCRHPDLYFRNIIITCQKEYDAQDNERQFHEINNTLEPLGENDCTKWDYFVDQEHSIKTINQAVFGELLEDCAAHLRDPKLIYRYFFSPEAILFMKVLSRKGEVSRAYRLERFFNP